ncbi:hypothetical protein A2U01_0065212, partial [Trifolium medium]|nr:hypothetical protein [Trifolium medium]
YISFEEAEHVESRYVGEGFCFYPLGKVINSDDEVFAMRESCREWSEDIHAPPGERLRR